MKKIDSSLPCPSCQGPLTPRVLGCAACGIKVEGDFRPNEFSGLTPELLHFLRIFVVCEGRIKDMEKALGVSYPTVKATMAKLKAALGHVDVTAEPVPVPAPAPATANDSLSILSAMERGDISYEDGLQRLQALKARKGT